MSKNEEKPPAYEGKEEEDADESKEEERGPDLLQYDDTEEPPLTANLRAASQHEKDRDRDRDAKQQGDEKLPPVKSSKRGTSRAAPSGIEEMHDSDDDAPRPGVAPGAVAMEPGSFQDSLQAKMLNNESTNNNIQSEELGSSTMTSSNNNFASSMLSNNHEDDEEEPPNPFAAEARRSSGSGSSAGPKRTKAVPTSRVYKAAGPRLSSIGDVAEEEEDFASARRNSNNASDGNNGRNSGNVDPSAANPSTVNHGRAGHQGGYYADNTINTDNAIVETDMPQAVPVNPDDDDEDMDEINEGARGVVYDAYKVDPNDMPPPPPDNKWKRKVVFGVGALSVAVIIAAVVGPLVTSKNETDSSGAKGVGSADYSSPTEAPTLPPAPLNCTIKDMGPVWPEDYCNWCDIVLGRDGDTIFITNSDAYAPEGEIIKGFEVLVGPFRMESHVPSDAMKGIAFSDTHFFAADTSAWKAGAVVRVSPKGPSGEILAGAAVDVRPAPGNTEENSMFGWAIAVDDAVLAVGAPNDDDFAGSAFVFRQNPNNASDWTEEAKFTPPDLGVQNFGNSVLVKENFVVVAADQYGDDTEGAVFFYEYDPLSQLWMNLTNHTLFNEDCDGNFGTSLAFTGEDGLLVSCPMKDDATGVVYYYQRVDKDDGVWEFVLTQTIGAKGGKPLDKFGGNNKHITMNPKGDFMAIGTYDEVTFGANEAMYLFSKFDNSWLQVGKIDAPRDNTYFGDKAVMSGDRVLISSWENAFLYEMTCVEDRDQIDQEQETGE